jgi:hypothetical protein
MEVHQLGFPWDNGEVGDANGSENVGLDGTVGLGPTYFNEGLSEKGLVVILAGAVFYCYLIFENSTSV